MRPRSTSYLKARSTFSIRAILTKNNSRTDRMRVKANSPLFNLAEAFGFSALVALYIWQLQPVYKYSWLVFPAWLIVSFVLHRDSPKTLGWQMDNLWIATKKSVAVLLPFGIALCIVGLFLDGLHRPVNHVLVPRRFFGYMFFCLLQQDRKSTRL